MYDAIEPAAGPEAGGHDGSGHDGMGHHPSEGGGFIDGLSDADRDMAASYGWRDTAGILEGYRSLEDRLSGALQVPGEAAGTFMELGPGRVVVGGALPSQPPPQLIDDTYN